MSRLAVAAATLAVLVFAAPAAAAPIPGASYGGGVPLGFNDRLGSVFVDAHVAADGSTARVRVNVRTRCGGGLTLNQRFVASGAIDAAGRLRAGGRGHRYVGPGVERRKPRGRGSVNLVFDGANASGTVRARVGTRCDSGARSVQLRVANTDVSPAAGSTAGAAYFGTVDRAYRGLRTAFALRVNGAGTRIRAAIFGAGLHCARGVQYLANISPPMKINSDGTFRRVERFTMRYRNAVDRTRIVFDGRFTAQGATGAVSVVQVTTLRDGRRATCRSGRIAWNAVR